MSKIHDDEDNEVEVYEDPPDDEPRHIDGKQDDDA
jgi:hypothetical protein